MTPTRNGVDHDTNETIYHSVMIPMEAKAYPGLARRRAERPRKQTRRVDTVLPRTPSREHLRIKLCPGVQIVTLLRSAHRDRLRFDIAH